jgi:hypothetical protein
MNLLENEAQKNLSWMYTNKYVNITLLILLGVYFVITPKISKFVELLYSNIVFRILIILLIIFFANHDPRLAIMITVVYLLTLNKINNIENFTNDKVNKYSTTRH